MAGLLDYLYDPATFGGNGGLLSRLQPSLSAIPQSSGFPQDQAASFNDRFNAVPGAPQQFTPSGRSFDTATFDPATFAPNQAQPVAVGGYQMPRMGGADLYQPQQAQLPQNATPTQGQMQPQAPDQMQAPQQLPPALGGGGGFSLGNLGRAFNPDGLIARLTGNDSRSVAQQNLKAQYDATRQLLQQNGLSPQEASSRAMMAVMNPEAGKTILSEALTSKEKFHTLKDGMGREVPAFINERDQTINGKPISEYNASTANTGLDGLQRARDAGISGDALYGYLPKEMAPTVKAMVEGRQPLPSTQAMRSPATLALIDAAHAIDPTFDATSWGARSAGAKDFTSGKSAEMVRAANQTLAHVGSLLDAMDNLKNRSMPAWNAVANTVSEQLGTGEQGAFRTNAHAVAEEMSKVFKGANLSDAEIRHWEQNLSENMSPTQQKAQIAKLSELLHGSLAALEEKRAAAIGPMAAAKAGPVIKEEGQKVLDRIDNWVKGNGATSQAAGGVQDGATATNPQTGQKITFRNGKWQ